MSLTRREFFKKTAQVVALGAIAPSVLAKVVLAESRLKHETVPYQKPFKWSVVDWDEPIRLSPALYQRYYASLLPQQRFMISGYETVLYRGVPTVIDNGLFGYEIMLPKNLGNEFINQAVLFFKEL